MLAELRVRRLALLDEVEVAFDDGLNVVSGETGEGKSLLLSAVLLLLGERADKTAVRTGCDEAAVEGRFLLSPTARAEIRALTDLVAEDESEVCLRRVVQADGRSRAYLNGQMCPVGLLKSVGAKLVDVHGQRDGQSLLKSDEQRAALDRFAGATELASVHAAAWSRRRELTEAIETTRREGAEREERRRRIVEDLDELEKARLVAGEAAALVDERRLIARRAELERLLDETAAELHEDRGATGARAGKLARRFAEFAALDPRLAEIAERLSALQSESVETARAASRLRQELGGGAARLAKIESRLEALHDLERRHRVRGDGLLAHRDALRDELDRLAAAASAESLEAELATSESELHRTATELWRARRAAGATLGDEIVASLRDLRLPHARFVVDPGVAEAPPEFDAEAMGPAGYGKPRFLVSMNVGEPPKPLEEVASGGETARVLLSLKGALAGHHRTPLLVFDEIDAGVGARVGAAFGRRLAALAAHHQVLVVTHLAQTAAFAKRHLLVRKRVAAGRTTTGVHVLGMAERVRELAEMLGGSGASGHAEAQAAELLAEAGR
jgi:DNA repair protein RecN (Recombination protein N)